MKKSIEYRALVREEIAEWKKIEAEMSRRGIPWWADVRQAKIKGKNIFWRNDPRKESIIRGKERELLLKLASGEKRQRVLDIGCGSGWLSLELGRKGMNVIGLDVSRERLAIARKMLQTNPYKKNFGTVKYLCADINQIDFPQGHFDTIVAWDTLHHFPNLDEVLAKSREWLKPGGKFIVYDHVGNRFLKIGRKLVEAFSGGGKTKVISYEDTLGKTMIVFLRKYFREVLFKTRLSFPVSTLLFLILSRDVFLPILPLVAKIDRFVCDSHLFYGEYFFFHGTKR